jgi:hypothetical protein
MSKKLRITTQSAYKLMKKQALQAGGSTGAPEQVVCIEKRLKWLNH